MWRSGYWHKWYDGLDLSDDLDVHEDGDVLEAVLEQEDNNDTCDVGAATESVVGSPPDADDDRRSGLAAPDQEQQGGPVYLPQWRMTPVGAAVKISKNQSPLRSLSPVAVRSGKAEILHIRSLCGDAVRRWRCRRLRAEPPQFNAGMARTLTRV